ncbi:hypothetical protein [Haloarchaeobius sp. DT45]|uniref:hypothetical protein n=1 Tax=Haloarchaeobius sp. DT45 TaxID=3446116 RepID=UPI003F6C8221
MSRRKLLRATVTAGATAVGVSGLTGATAEQRDAAGSSLEGFDTRPEIDARSFKKYAGDDSKTKATFDEYFESIATQIGETDATPPSSLDEAQDIEVIPDPSGGTMTPQLVATFETDAKVEVRVDPVEDRATAHVERDGETKFVDAAEGVRTVMGCYYEHFCASWGCSINTEWRMRVCEFPDGTYSRTTSGFECGCARYGDDPLP